MDLITENYLGEFSDNYQLKEKDKSTLFEHFANYTVLKNEYETSTFEIKSIHTGDSAQGIDGIAIIANNRLCTSVEEVKDSISYSGKLEVNFVFIQAKTSPKFDGPDIDSYLGWIETFFKFKQAFKTSEMKNFQSIAKYIYDNSRFFKPNKPNLKIYYVCNGKWKNDSNINTIVQRNKDVLSDTNYFNNIEFIPCDAGKTQKMYMKTKMPVQTSIVLDKSINLPNIKGVKSAKFGVLPFREFIKLISNQKDQILPVFEDNIRGFLGTENPVNEGITQTLNEGDFDQFCLLNNGVTIVAEEITGAGADITLKNYQIVNGCQTSNVLFQLRKLRGMDQVTIPVKIIETSEPDIRLKVTRATNNQTQVKLEQLEALTDYQRQLEQYYNAMAKKYPNKPLYYERRSNQYKDKLVNPADIIDIENQIKVFTAMFCEKPYIVSGYYSKILKGLGKDVFNVEHKPIMYYTSALAYKQFTFFMNQHRLNEKIWRFRYHFIMLVKYYITKLVMPRTNSKDMENYCGKIINVLVDDEKCFSAYKEIQEFLFSLDSIIKISGRKSSEKKLNNQIILQEAYKKYLDKQTRFF